MKASKLLFLSVVLSISVITSLFSQESNTANSSSKFALGAGGAYAFDPKEFGLHLDGVIVITPKIRLAPAFNYYFTGDDFVTFYTFDIDGQYILSSQNQSLFYGLAGIDIAVVKVDLDVPVIGDIFSESSTDIGLNVGAGGEYQFGNKLKGFGETKYVFGDQDGLVLTAGIRYNF